MSFRIGIAERDELISEAIEVCNRTLGPYAYLTTSSGACSRRSQRARTTR